MPEAADQFRLLDTAIGLFFVFLILSVMVTAIVEAIAALLNLRAVNLTQGMLWLLDGKQGMDEAGKTAHPGWRERLAWWIMGQRFDGKAGVAAADGAPASEPGEINVTPPGSLARDLLEHPLIYRLAPGAQVPSYIDSKLFAVALIDVLRKRAGTASGANTADDPTVDAVNGAFADIPGLIGKIENADVKKVLLPIVVRAQAGVDKAEERVDAAVKAIQDWFDSSMDRVAGWYKKRIHGVTLAVGILLTVIVNADSVAIVKALWSDGTLRQSLLLASSKVVENPQLLNGACNRTVTAAPATQASPNTTAASTTASTTPTSTTASSNPMDDVECWLGSVRDLNAQLAGLPIGWDLGLTTPSTAKSGAAAADPLTSLRQWAGAVLAQVPSRLVGWLLTVAALSLGAPFWFDLLSRFVRLRGTGPKPGEQAASAPARPQQQPQSAS